MASDKKKAEERKSGTLGLNRKARFEYEILDTLECGIVLTGTEVKSLREGKISFVDSFCRIKGDELFVHSLHISPYEQGNIHNHEALRVRKLLAHKDEIKRLRKKVEERGLTLVPTKIYLKHGMIKIEIALARGKKLHDKRDSIKERDLSRDAKAAIKQAMRG